MLFLITLLFCSTLSAASYSKQNITIYFHTGHEKFAKLIVNNLSQDIETFQKKIGSYPNLPLKIYLTKDKAEYRKYCGSSQAIIEFSEACYSPSRNAMILRSIKDLKDTSKLRQIILHEYIHHFINSQIKNPPLWFNEGMAVYFSGGLTYARELNFVKNYILGNSLSLNEMRRSYPKNRIEWESFYAKSALAVKYLATKKKENFYMFWEKVAKTGNFDSAFLQSFYFTSWQFSGYFEDYAKKHFRIELLLASSSLLWAFFPIIFLIGVLRRKLKNRKVLRHWQAQEMKNLNDIGREE